VKHAAKVHRYEGLGSFRYALEVRDDAGHDVWSLPAECDSLVARAAQVWQAEIERLRQGLWDCAVIAGEDPDGNETPAHLIFPDIVEFAQQAVQRLRRDYDDGLDDFIAAEEARRG
jgi:hypothetical protein